MSDRGSVESVGVVTDVGLFLNLLTQRLEKLEHLLQEMSDRLKSIESRLSQK